MNREALRYGKDRAVLLLRDGFTGQTLNDPSASFRLGNVACAPIRRGDGFHVFLNISDASPCLLDIACPGFLDAQVTLTAISLPLEKPLAEVVTVCDLEPSAFYAYPPGTTIVCGQVTSAGKPLAGAEVFACFSDRQGEWHWRRTLSHESGRCDDWHQGHYALALPSAASNSNVNLRFAKDGHGLHFHQVAPARSMTTIVGADLQRANT